MCFQLLDVWSSFCHRSYNNYAWFLYDLDQIPIQRIVSRWNHRKIRWKQVTPPNNTKERNGSISRLWVLWKSDGRALATQIYLNKKRDPTWSEPQGNLLIYSKIRWDLLMTVERPLQCLPQVTSFRCATLEAKRSNTTLFMQTQLIQIP